MDAQRILPGNSGGQQPSKDHPGMELSTEGDFNCVQNKKAKNEVVLCSVNSACSRELKNTIFFLSLIQRAFTQQRYKTSKKKR